MSKFWNEENVATLEGIVGGENPVTQDTVKAAAVQLDVTVRSVASKLRNMDYDVESAAQAHKSAWDEGSETELRSFLEKNDSTYTYAEISAVFGGGKFSPKSIQGKVLSMDMTAFVKPTEKVVAARKYNEEEERRFIKMSNEGNSIEAIAAALGREINSIRGKALSLSRSIEGFTIPHQAESHAKNKQDLIENLGDLSKMTVEEIGEAVGKTERGVKTTLTRRGLSCADYDGEKKKARREAKAEEKAAEEEAA